MAKVPELAGMLRRAFHDAPMLSSTQKRMAFGSCARHWRMTPVARCVTIVSNKDIVTWHCDAFW
jgi:hypothetical protein